jgi:uncharacterized membrane protein
MAKEKEAESSGDNTKLCAFLAYLLIGIIWYFADEKMKKNDFVKFHVKQGLVLLITAIIFSFFYGILVFIPIIGWFIIAVLQLCVLILLVMGIINALNGKENPLPIIGGFAKKFTF